MRQRAVPRPWIGRHRIWRRRCGACGVSAGLPTAPGLFDVRLKETDRRTLWTELTWRNSVKGQRLFQLLAVQGSMSCSLHPSRRYDDVPARSPEGGSTDLCPSPSSDRLQVRQPLVDLKSDSGVSLPGAGG